MNRFLPRILALALLLLPVLPGARAQNTTQQESRRAALQKEIAQLEQQIKENTARSNSALSELTLVRKQIATRRSLVEESEREIRRISDTIAVRQAAADRLQQRLESMETYYHRLVRNAYKNRDARVWYSYLLSSRDLGQATRRYVYLRDLSGEMNAQARKLKGLRAELGEELVRLSALRSEAEAVKKEHEQELQGLRKSELRSDQLVSDLKKDKTLYQRQLNAKRKQVEALNREIDALSRRPWKRPAARNRRRLPPGRTVKRTPDPRRRPSRWTSSWRASLPPTRASCPGRPTAPWWRVSGGTTIRSIPRW